MSCPHRLAATYDDPEVDKAKESYRRDFNAKGPSLSSKHKNSQRAASIWINRPIDVN